MADVKWDEKYSPAEATRGSWAPIDSSTITSLPSSSRGRYAQLTYNIGADYATPGASATNPSYIQIVDTDGEPVTISEDINVNGSLVNALNVRIAESVTTLSAFQIDATGISGLDIFAGIQYPDTTIYESTTIPTEDRVVIDFGRNVTEVELFNNNQSVNLYYSFNDLTVNELSAQALPLTPQTFYSINRDTRYIYLGNADDSQTVDVRVVGHYRNK